MDGRLFNDAILDASVIELRCMPKNDRVRSTWKEHKLSSAIRDVCSAV